MAAQVITTDLITVADAEPGSLGNWTALGGGQSGLSEETDFAVQGQTSISKQVRQETKGMHADNGSSFTFSAGQHVYVWLYATTPGATDFRAQGGLRITLGASGNARSEYYVNGRDFYRYGGWVCYPVSPNATPDTQVGGGGGSTPRYFGGIMSNFVTVKGLNFGVDVIRVGSTINISGGGGSDPQITFTDVSNTNDLQNNAWGIFQGTDTGGNLQGKLVFGVDDGTTLTDFSDSDKVLVITNKNPSGVQLKTDPDFTQLRFQGTNTSAVFTGCTFLSLDSHDKGSFNAESATNPALLEFQSSVLQDIGQIGLNSRSSINESKLTRCGLVVQNGGTLDGDTFIDSDAVVAGNDLGNITNCNFSRTATNGHAITTTINSSSVSFIGNTFDGYGADGTAQAAIHFTASSGAVTVNVTGGDLPTFLSNGVNVTIQSSSTLTLVGLQPLTEVRIYEAGTTTEVAGVENSGTSEVFAISVPSVDIVLHALGYLNQRSSNVDTTANLTLPVQQTFDRQYDNP